MVWIRSRCRVWSNLQSHVRLGFARLDPLYSSCFCGFNVTHDAHVDVIFDHSLFHQRHVTSVKCRSTILHVLRNQRVVCCSPGIGLSPLLTVSSARKKRLRRRSVCRWSNPHPAMNSEQMPTVLVLNENRQLCQKSFDAVLYRHQSRWEGGGFGSSSPPQ